MYRSGSITDYCTPCNDYVEKCVDYIENKNGSMRKEVGCTECGFVHIYIKSLGSDKFELRESYDDEEFCDKYKDIYEYTDFRWEQEV